MATVVHKETEFFDTYFSGVGWKATVVLDDGRIGYGESTNGIAWTGTEAKAISAAIENAKSQEIPEK